MLRLLRLAAITLVALYAVVVVALYVMQRSLLYPGAFRSPVVSAAEAGLEGVQDLTLATPDGERLRAFWKPPEGGKPVLVFFHGNGSSLSNRRARIRLLTEGGHGLLIASYRGFSGSTGSPTEEGLRIDARTAYDWLARSIEPRRIVLYGESLGTGVAVRLATERSIGGLVLDAPYTSTAEVASETYWYVPVGLLMHDQFRSIEIIGQVKNPILIMHGEADRIIPIRFGERLHAAAPEPKRFVRLAGVGHERVLESGGLAELRAFLQTVEATNAKTAADIPKP